MPKDTNPKSNIRKGLPRKRRTVVFKLSFTNVLIVLFIVFIGYYFLSALSAKDKGREIGVDEFVSNIKNDNYAQVDIQFSGEAIAYDKYLDIVRPQEGSDSQIEINKDSGYKSRELEERDIDYLLEKLDTTSDYARQVKDVFSGGKGGIIEFVVLENAVIARTHGSDTTDYLIKDTNEQELKQKLDNRGVKTEGIIWTYQRAAGEIISQDDFDKNLEDGVYERAWEIEGVVYAKENTNKIKKEYVNWKGITDDFSKFLQDEGINFSSENVEIISIYNPPVSFDSLLMIGGILALIFAVSLLAKAMQGQGNSLMQFGQSKARLFWGKKPEITFKDVAGVNEAKEELNEVVMFLKDPKRFLKLGARIPKGMLMVGPPGTGKTLLAKAIAGEAGVPFFHTSGSEFEEMLVGAGASRVRDLFTKAKKSAPSLIFIDEIDAIARKRGTTVQSSHTEQTLNQILVEMDGFETNQNVIVIAATNRPDVLDPAILRPGRFDRRIVIELPDMEGRVDILKIHARNKPLAADVNLEEVAKRTVGFSGADLENMLNEAAIITAKADRKELTKDDIEEAATKVVAGPEKKRKREQEELKMTAYHEAGHAIVAKLTPKTDPVHRVTIVSRGMALGWTMQLPQKDKYQQTQEELVGRIKVLMGGRAAEELVFGDITSGASNDIEKATSIARKMVKQFGMSKKLGLVKYGESNELQYLGYGYGEQRDYSDNTADDIDNEVKTIIGDAYDKAKQILEKNRALLDKLVDMLMDHEVVEASEFESLFTTK